MTRQDTTFAAAQSLARIVSHELSPSLPQGSAAQRERIFKGVCALAKRLGRMSLSPHDLAMSQDVVDAAEAVAIAIFTGRWYDIYFVPVNVSSGQVIRMADNERWLARQWGVHAEWLAPTMTAAEILVRELNVPLQNIPPPRR